MIVKARKRLGQYCVKTITFGIAIAISSEINTHTLAQISPDNTLGTENSVVTPVNPDASIESINGGAIRGANLFHSFEQFNIREGQTAVFTNPAGIERIFSRVTGNSASEIFGTLGVGGNADLFFLNPNGIIFGANAQLNINGSFLASTASAIQFDDGTLFSAKNPQSPPILQLNLPIGLQFASNPGSIVNRSVSNFSGVPNIGNPSGLLVPPGNTLALVGGELRLEGGNLTSPGGRIELGSVADTGFVSLTPTVRGWSLDYAGINNFQDIQLSQRATVNTSSLGAGEIQVQGSRVTLKEDSRLISFTLGSQQPGNVTINAAESLEIFGTGNYRRGVELFSTGIANPNELRNGIFSANSSTGGAGNITIDTPKLIAENGAFIATSTFGQGRGGNLTINAKDSIELTASALGTGTGLRDSGKAGDVTISTNKLIASEGSLISTSTLGQGQGGAIAVTADTIELTGSEPILVFLGFPLYTSLISGTSGTGTSGDIKVKTKNLSLQNRAQLSAPSVGTGQGGNIDVQADSLSLSSGASIITISTATGLAGNISLRLNRDLTVNNGNIVASAEQSSGGEIRISASNILLLEDSDISTNVSSGIGRGGNIFLNAEAIFAFDDSDIVAFARDGRGGNIQLNTPAFFGVGYLPNSNVSPASLDGNARVDVNASGQLASGTITIPDVSFLQNNLAELPSEPIDTNTLLANSCIVRSDRRQGSFTITGAGALPVRPGDAMTLSYATGTVRPIPSTSAASHPWQLGDPILEPQAAYRLADGQLVLSRECP